MSVTSGAKAGFGAVKTHWIFFLIAAAVLVGLAFHYDAKNPGKVRDIINKTLGALPVVGDWFKS